METKELIDKFDTHHKAVLKLMEDAKEDAKSVDSRLAEIEQKIVRRGGGTALEVPVTWGKALAGSSELKAFREAGYRGTARVEVKTITTLGSGSGSMGALVPPDYRPDIVPLPKQRLTVRDLVAPGSTTSNAISFGRVAARQNNASTVAELGTKPQSDLTTELVTANVQTIAHWIAASRQILDDAAGLQSLVDAELRYGLALVEEAQLLAGDNTGANLYGIIPQASAYAAPFTVTGETPIDRVLLGLLQAELAMLPSSGVVLHPTDFGKMRLTKDGMGRHILGDPNAPALYELWGVPLVISLALPVGHFLCGAFKMAAQIFDRLTAEVLISTEHGTFFVENKVAIRGEERLAFAVKRPTAFIYGALP